MSDYKPPFHVTDKMTSLIAEISEQVGRITMLQEETIRICHKINHTLGRMI